MITFMQVLEGWRDAARFEDAMKRVAAMINDEDDTMARLEEMRDAGMQGELFEDGESERQKQLALELSEWWMAKAQDEVDAVVHKAVEYGSTSLQAVGDALLVLVPKHLRSSTLGMEMAIAFYVQGKIARIFSAFERGEHPGDDHWHDISVYARMAQYVRQYGTWVD